MPDLAADVRYYDDSLDILRRYAPDATWHWGPSAEAM
jgi:hypothetical protein